MAALELWVWVGYSRLSKTWQPYSPPFYSTYTHASSEVTQTQKLFSLLVGGLEEEEQEEGGGSKGKFDFKFRYVQQGERESRAAAVLDYGVTERGEEES